MSEQILKAIEEQLILGFTGKLNILDSDSKQLLGAAYIIAGKLANFKYLEVEGIKAFYNACIEEKNGKQMEIITEPELIDIRESKIQQPFSVLKRKMYDIADKYEKSKKNKPPGHLKLIVQPGFITSDQEVNSLEYSLMCTISDYSLVSDIYKKSSLLDYEITNALVGLRKKNALKVIQHK